MSEYNYEIFVPGGNDTALVIGIERDEKKRKTINDEIMSRHPNVEQVGFVNEDKAKHELLMAGGEFCGNATRSAAYYYLDGKPGEIKIKSSGAKALLSAGVTSEGDAWAQMPVGDNLYNISEIESGIYLVHLEGISHLVLMPSESKAYLEGEGDIKISAMELISKNSLEKLPAAGVMLLEEISSGIKMHPYVYVSAIDTTFYETACGSGTTAVGLVYSRLKGGSIEMKIAQPSGKEISVSVELMGKTIKRACISGEISVFRAKA